MLEQPPAAQLARDRLGALLEPLPDAVDRVGEALELELPRETIGGQAVEQRISAIDGKKRS